MPAFEGILGETEGGTAVLPMMESGCRNCPVKNCTAAYRGSECAANRAKAGIDTDPLTNGEYIRQADDNQLADILYGAIPGIVTETLRRLGITDWECPDIRDKYVEWLRSPCL